MARQKKSPGEIVKQAFATRLKAARERKFPSAAAFARRIGIEDETYRRWERAETEPGVVDLNKILEELNISADYLIPGPPASRPRP